MHIDKVIDVNVREEDVVNINVVLEKDYPACYYHRCGSRQRFRLNGNIPMSVSYLRSFTTHSRILIRKQTTARLLENHGGATTELHP